MWNCTEMNQAENSAPIGRGLGVARMLEKAWLFGG
jgi:hypothetical protein